MNLKGTLIVYLVLSGFTFSILSIIINVLGFGGAFITAFGLPLLIAAVLLGSAVALVIFKKYIHLFD